MAPRKKVRFCTHLLNFVCYLQVAKEEAVVTQLGPRVADDVTVFATAHIFASFNDTFVHITDLSGEFCLFL
jgi:hypothetical protein